MLANILRYEAMSEVELYRALTAEIQEELEKTASIDEKGIKVATLHHLFSDAHLMYVTYKRHHSDSENLPVVKDSLMAIISNFGHFLGDSSTGVLERLRIVLL